MHRVRPRPSSRCVASVRCASRGFCWRPQGKSGSNGRDMEVSRLLFDRLLRARNRRASGSRWSPSQQSLSRASREPRRSAPRSAACAARRSFRSRGTAEPRSSSSASRRGGGSVGRPGQSDEAGKVVPTRGSPRWQQEGVRVGHPNPPSGRAVDSRYWRLTPIPSTNRRSGWALVVAAGRRFARAPEGTCATRSGAESSTRIALTRLCF
jgi:hypothetical protein